MTKRGVGGIRQLPSFTVLWLIFFDFSNFFDFFCIFVGRGGVVDGKRSTRSKTIKI